jgi:hypothetical protein
MNKNAESREQQAAALLKADLRGLAGRQASGHDAVTPWAGSLK